MLLFPLELLLLLHLRLYCTRSNPPTFVDAAAVTAAVLLRQVQKKLCTAARLLQVKTKAAGTAAAASPIGGHRTHYSATAP